jgi:capping protein (actin filament) muscle Z-line, beta
MDSAQSIAQKTPPAALETTLDGLRTVLIHNPDASDALMKKYYIPFDHVIDSSEKGEKPFLTCLYNKVGDMYRSPWTGKLHPLSKNDASSNSTSNNSSAPASTPRRSKNDEMLLVLEKSLNDVWDSYKNLYYGHDSVGSVYVKDVEKGSFQGFFGIRKRSSEIGSWDSVSIVVVDEPTDKECTYRVETHVRVVIIPEVGDDSSATISGTTTQTDMSVLMSKESVTTCKVVPDKIPINVSHIENIGTIIEDSEMEIRSVMETVYLPKNYEIVTAIQKQPVANLPSNPVMGIMMDSGMLKKRFASQDHETTTSFTTGSAAGNAGTPTRRPMGIPQGVNPLMAGAMNSKILLKKKQQQQDQQNSEGSS